MGTWSSLKEMEDVGWIHYFAAAGDTSEACAVEVVEVDHSDQRSDSSFDLSLVAGYNLDVELYLLHSPMLVAKLVAVP